MKNIYSFWIILTLIVVSNISFAATYKCEDQGVITYSDTPCKGKALSIDGGALKSIPKKPAHNTYSGRERTEKTLKVLEESRQQRETQRKIRDLERDIELLTQERNGQLEAIKKQLEYPEVDVNDDDDELRVRDMKTRLSGEMSAISAQYEEKIRHIRRQIKELRGN